MTLVDWTNERRREALAADYVLGLLQGRALVRFEKRMREDAALERSVWQLRERLDPLLRASPQDPPEALWQRIEKDLGWRRQKERRWSLIERLSIAAAVVSLVVAVGLGAYVQTQPPVQRERLLAVLHNANERHVLRVSLTADGRAVTVVALRELSVPPGRSLELWALPKHGAPVAVGLLSPRTGQAHRYRLRAPVSELGGFAVSVEPPGGSPKKGPTGPILLQGTIAMTGPSGGASTVG